MVSEMVSEILSEILSEFFPKPCPSEILSVSEICPKFVRTEVRPKSCPCPNFGPSQILSVSEFLPVPCPKKTSLLLLAYLAALMTKNFGKAEQILGQQFGRNSDIGRQNFGQSLDKIRTKHVFLLQIGPCPKLCPNLGRPWPSFCPKFCPTLLE